MKIVYYQCMSPSKEEIKEWLKTTGKDRFWLAEQCDASKRTVDNWLADTGVLPPRAILLISSLMNEDEGEKEPSEEEEITLKFSPSEMQILRAFKEAFPDVDIESYCHDKALEFCIGMSALAANKSQGQPPIDIPTTFRGTGTHLPDPQKEVGRDQWKEFVPDKPSPQ